MQLYDIIVLVLLIAATAWGARRGLAKQLATLGSLALGYTVAVNGRAQVAPMIQLSEPWNIFAAMLLLFAATSLLVWLVFRVVDRSIEKNGLGAFDAQMGGVLGLVKGGVLALAMTMFSVVMLGDAQRSAVLGSFSGYNMCRVLANTRQIVPVEWQEFMEPYLRPVEDHHAAEQLPDEPRLPEDYAVEESPSDLYGTAQYDDPGFGNYPPAEPDRVQANRSRGWRR